ncbi:MAG: IS630 family transposase [Candidatus Latescibacteria bacterium]|nr:IS630 family transposase [Candidatus Latescibacterota bacterium]MBT5829689.1 IS630 family transposase [Candidatus Latescibacterota bacterium]
MHPLPNIPASAPLPSRWSLRVIRERFEFLSDYTLSGVWRYLTRYGFKLRTGRLQMYSPDPDYEAKVATLHQCLGQTASQPDQTVTLFLDEMSYHRWPAPGKDWTEEAPSQIPKAPIRGTNPQWRIIGALNAWTGQVQYLDGSTIGVQKIIQMYDYLNHIYKDAQNIYVIQDCWPVHQNKKIFKTIASWPRIKPIFLPTYAPWLNPIEKLWRWLKQDVLKMHQFAVDFDILKQYVRDFLEQFNNGSSDLLKYTGLIGQGLFAQTLHP